MSSTEPLTGLNPFEAIFYYFSVHFRQYLYNCITNVGFQWDQSLRIVRVNTIHQIKFIAFKSQHLAAQLQWYNIWRNSRIYEVCSKSIANFELPRLTYIRFSIFLWSYIGTQVSHLCREVRPFRMFS